MANSTEAQVIWEKIFANQPHRLQPIWLLRSSSNRLIWAISTDDSGAIFDQ
jgi:hypothetical protein